MDEKKWSLTALISSLAVLAVIAAFNFIVDPFLHFHKPLEALEYPLNDERYTNDGIARHFEYEAVITGTSMTQNFKASQMEALWGVKTVKIAYAGASLHELAKSLERVFRYSDTVKYVVMGLDVNRINQDKDGMEYEEYPEYLYDRNPFNDVRYVLNKDVLPRSLAVLNYTRAGNRTVSFDEYGAFDQSVSHGKDAVMQTWKRLDEAEEETLFSKEDETRVRGNLTENVYDIALRQPDTEFYFFFPPYSICHWDSMVRTKQLNMDLQSRKLACEILLSLPNVHLFEFADDTDVVGNLDNYSDALHYSAEVNEYILQNIYDGSHELKADTYEAFYEDLTKLYASYDYEAVFD